MEKSREITIKGKRRS